MYIVQSQIDLKDVDNKVKNISFADFGSKLCGDNECQKYWCTNINMHITSPISLLISFLRGFILNTIKMMQEYLHGLQNLLLCSEKELKKLSWEIIKVTW